MASLAAAGAASSGLPAKAVDAIVAGSLRDAITAASVLAGFLASGLTIMLAVADTPVVQSLRSTGHYDRMIGYYWFSLGSFFWFLVAALCLCVLGDCGARVWHFERTVPAALAFTSVLSATSGVRVVRFLVRVLLRKGLRPVD